MATIDSTAWADSSTEFAVRVHYVYHWVDHIEIYKVERISDGVDVTDLIDEDDMVIFRERIVVEEASDGFDNYNRLLE